MTEINLFLPDLSATAKIAARLGALLRPQDCVALHGDLGAGKTAFCRALIQALNPAESEVPSPTFTLLQTYTVPQGLLYHFDLYRLSEPQDIYEIGWDEAQSGIMLIEWPQRLGRLLPHNRIDVTLSHGKTEDERFITIRLPHGHTGESLA